MTTRPKSHPFFEAKWVFRNKLDDFGNLVRNKDRLVAHSCNQEEGIDYDGIFIPVARLEVIRMLLKFASFRVSSSIKWI